MADDKVKKIAERSMWDRFTDTFRPTAARADDNIAENRRKLGAKLAESSPMYLEKKKPQAYTTKGLVDDE